MRIKIPLPPPILKEKALSQEPHFSSQIKLRVGDMNYGNHMGNDTVLSLAHEFRVQLFDQYGQNELSFFGKGIIMADSAIQYRAQGFWGQIIKAHLWYIPTSQMRFDLYYRLFTQGKSKEEEKEKEEDIAYVKTGQVFFDYEQQRVSSPGGEDSSKYRNFLKELNVAALI